MLRIFSLDETAAAQATSIDIVSAPFELQPSALARGGPTLVSMTGGDHR